LHGQKEVIPVARGELTDKQKRFVEEYLIDLNATQAAIRAGYSEKTADRIGPELLGKTWVKQAIIEKQKERSERVKIDTDWVLARLKLISDRCVQGEPVMKYNHETKEYEPTGEWKFDSAGANRATELIGKHLGMFIERQEISGKDGGPIELRCRAADLTDGEIDQLLGE
jgi:phage terminase small subunit